MCLGYWFPGAEIRSFQLQPPGFAACRQQPHRIKWRHKSWNSSGKVPMRIKAVEVTSFSSCLWSSLICEHLYDSPHLQIFRDGGVQGQLCWFWGWVGRARLACFFVSHFKYCQSKIWVTFLGFVECQHWNKNNEPDFEPLFTTDPPPCLLWAWGIYHSVQ